VRRRPRKKNDIDFAERRGGGAEKRTLRSAAAEAGRATLRAGRDREAGRRRRGRGVEARGAVLGGVETTAFVRSPRRAAPLWPPISRRV